MTARVKIGAVCLTYNSADDLADCLDGLFAQEGVDLHVIVVDNASSPNNRARMEEIFAARAPDGEVLDAADATPDTVGETRALFLRNGANAGYSAGNNIGARMAVALGCSAVLIVNPDVRIEDPGVAAGLAAAQSSSPDIAVVAPAVVDLAGVDENPSTELSFVDEVLAPLRMVLSSLKIWPQRGTAPVTGDAVERISGAFFLVRAEFLEEIGFFDESVFLYCEESILAAQVRDRTQRIVYRPDLRVLHAHDTTRKGDPVRRYQAWALSRAYYHRTYTRYGLLRRAALRGARALTLAVVKTYHKVGRRGAGGS